jgi:putative aldouronate transport system substrate-binding protein
MKKLIFVLLVLTAAALVFAGGGQGSTQGTGSVGGPYQRDPNLNAPGVFPVNKTTVPLKIGLQHNAMVEDWKTNWMTRQFEQRGNYNLSFEVYPAGELTQKVELMVMAGGADLPDVIIGGFSVATATKFGQAGMVIPTNVYYENSAHYINIAENDLSIDPRKYVTSYDGNIYGLYGINVSLNSQYSSGRIMIYEPWLRRLGLRMPETTDEFLNVLRAFRDRDPNGNGQRDEIPLVSYRENMQTNYLYSLMMPFIYTQPNFWMLNNGRIDVAFNKPAWRDGIRYTKQLIDEGLLSPLSFTQDNTQMTALISPDPPKVGAVVRISSSNLGANDTKRTEYWVVPPLQGPAGKNQLWMPILPNIQMMITKNCRSPEAAFMLGDLFAMEDLSVAQYYGEYGVDWVDPPPGSRGYVEGYPPLAVELLSWGTLQNKHWAGAGPQVRGNKWAFPDVANDSPVNYVTPIGRGLSDAIRYGTKTPISGIIYNDAEQSAMNEFHSTILSYVRESFARFAMGDLNIDRDWDNYVAEFNRMGLTDVIRATQSAWDRMNR